MFRLSVSPDFSPEHIAGWFVFNTWLQKKLGVRIHLELYDDFESQRAAIERNEIDIIYANPFDASRLVREKGFKAIAVVKGKCDEVVVAAAEESGIRSVEDLKPGARLAVTRDPDVNLIGMILLEPADLSRDTTSTQQVATYVLVAKALLQGRADAGFFLKEAFDDLSQVIRRGLVQLVASQISVVRHVMLVGPGAAELAAPMRDALVGMSTEVPQGVRALEAMGLDGWEVQSEEETEFMIDLMDTLVT